MKELYLQTDNELVLIDPKLIEKYNLKEGSLSPFSRQRVVDKNGYYPKINKDDKDKTDTDVSQMPEGEGVDDDEIAEFENGQILSQSEIIDFSQGTDSSDEVNKI